MNFASPFLSAAAMGAQDFAERFERGLARAMQQLQLGTDPWFFDRRNMGMDQYLLIPFLGGWTSIYQLFWCSPGVQGFDTLPYEENKKRGKSSYGDIRFRKSY